MWGKGRTAPKTILSPEMRELWGYIPIRHLVLASPEFIVYLDDVLDVEWKTTNAYDDTDLGHKQQRSAVLTRAAELEAGDWDLSDERQTLSLRRQIAEAIARAFEGDFAQAQQMLDRASEYRTSMRRKQSISEQVRINNEWRARYRRWTGVHYSIGVAALVFSTLVASRPTWIGSAEVGTSLLAWFVAILTGLLTFLTPDKKADKYLRAWSVLNTEITRFNADEGYSVDDVLGSRLN
jgi:hypothetical protein